MIMTAQLAMPSLIFFTSWYSSEFQNSRQLSLLSHSEITTELFDSPLSKVFQQAENRMWAQNAVLVTLFSQKLAS